MPMPYMPEYMLLAIHFVRADSNISVQRTTQQWNQTITLSLSLSLPSHRTAYQSTLCSARVLAVRFRTGALAIRAMIHSLPRQLGQQVLI